MSIDLGLSVSVSSVWLLPSSGGPFSTEPPADGHVGGGLYSRVPVGCLRSATNPASHVQVSEPRRPVI